MSKNTIVKRIVLYTVAVILVLAALITSYSVYLAISIQDYSTVDEKTASDTAIVLGAATENGEVSNVYRERINHAVWLYKNDYINKMILTGGVGKGNEVSDASAAKKYAISCGIPSNNILIEEKSTITEENLKNAKEIMDEKGLKSAIIVSDPLHMKRAMAMAENLGINACSSPTTTTAYSGEEAKNEFLAREIVMLLGYTAQSVIAQINDALYSYILIIVLILGGIYFTVRTKFVQFRLIGEQLRAVTEKPKDGKGVSSFQALMVSTASRVGTGNIVGVSTALCLGGFGSVFWMWLIAIIGAASAFIESTLAQIFKKKGPEGSYGGPAYYIEAALKNRTLAIVFTVFLILTYGVGFNMLASYNMQDTFSVYGFYDSSLTPWLIGAVIAATVAFCLFGGGKRIINATSFIVPIMGVAYILVSLVITLMNVTALPSIFGKIFTGAFDFKAIFGGLSGSCLMYGIKRGLFSNEAGVGSAPNASASAEVAHPVKQGLVQVLSVFIDTILVCSATAFMCMASGIEPSAEVSGAAYVQMAVKAAMGNIGPIFITVAMILFAFTTLLGNLFYVDKAFCYLLGRAPGKLFNTVYYILASLVILLGARLNADLLWNIADITMGGMTLINMPIIIYLSKYAIRALNDYTKQKKEGKEPIFHSKDIDLPHKVDYWD